MQRGQTWGPGEYQEYDYSRPSGQRPMQQDTWQPQQQQPQQPQQAQQQPPASEWQEFKGSDQFRQPEPYRTSEGFRGDRPSYRSGGWRGQEEWRGSEGHRGKEPAGGGFRRGEDYGYQDYPSRRTQGEGYGREGEWGGQRPQERRGPRPRGVSFAPSPPKEQERERPTTYENLLFKSGEVDLNDPYWKLKLEEPTNTWKNYGKKGIELPYYEGWWRPRADIFEEEGDNMRIEFELPGVPTDNISLSVNENLIIVTAVKPQVAREERGFYYQNERHFGNFYRKLELPTKVDTTKVSAHYDNGILKITLPILDKSTLKLKIRQGQFMKEQMGQGQQEGMGERQPATGTGVPPQQQPSSSDVQRQQQPMQQPMQQQPMQQQPMQQQPMQQQPMQQQPSSMEQKQYSTGNVNRPEVSA